MREKLVITAGSKGYYSFHTVNREVGNGWFIELCLLQKWIREVHEIDVFISPGKCYSYGKVYDVCIYKDYKIEVEMGSFVSYLEALEVGLQKALKLIENETNTN